MERRTASSAGVAVENEETREAWDGPLFERFFAFRDLIADSLGAHGTEALRLHPPGEGERVIDVGCGWGDTTQQIARLVGPAGSVLGVDLAPRFIELARSENAALGRANVAYEVADVQLLGREAEFDLAFSRFGTMFFDDPVAGLGQIRRALVPGGRLCMVVWRRKLDNGWEHRAELAVKALLAAEQIGEFDQADDADEAPAGPGPFSMADADTVSGQLVGAGFEEVELRRCDLVVPLGDLSRATDLLMAVGPAGAAIREAGDAAEALRPRIEAAVREALAEFETPDGVRAPSSTWIVTAAAGGGV